MEERITIEIIESKEFATENGGYSRKEVDRFLDQICDEIANLQDEIDGLNKQLAVAEARAKMTPAVEVAPAPVVEEPVAAAAPVPDGEFREILEMAHKVKNETIAAAEQKAAEIIANAEEEVKTRLGSLAEEKDALVAQVDSLRQAGLELREKIASVLKAQQEALDQSQDMF